MKTITVILLCTLAGGLFGLGIVMMSRMLKSGDPVQVVEIGSQSMFRENKVYQYMVYFETDEPLEDLEELKEGVRVLVGRILHVEDK